MLVVKSSESEIQISGNRKELTGVEKALIELSKDADRQSIEIPCIESLSPEPYTNVLKAIHVQRSDGPILVRVESDNLVMSASPSNLDVLASYFSFSDDEAIGSHNHFDYFEGDVYISPDSRSLVVLLGDLTEFDR